MIDDMIYDMIDEGKLSNEENEENCFSFAVGVGCSVIGGNAFDLRVRIMG
jgi:hypothetical protein